MSSETQSVDGNALVDTVKHSGKVQIWRKPQRGEAETAHAEAAERLGVGPRRQAVRNHPGARVLGKKRAGHRVVQGSVRGGLERDVCVEDLARHAPPATPFGL